MQCQFWHTTNVLQITQTRKETTNEETIIIDLYIDMYKYADGTNTVYCW